MPNGLTIGTMTLQATFECLSVKCSYTGDDNGDATAGIEYKLSSSSTWHNAYTPYIDRRATTNGHSNVANQFQARGSIVGLANDTSYDIRLTWTDPDGVTGTNPVTGSISTRTWTPPLGGTQIYVDSAAGGGGDGSSGNPYNTIAAAVTAAVAGDTINLKGTFGATTITKSGNSGAWIKFQQWNASLTIGGSSDSMTIVGDYLWFYNFTVASSTNNGITVNGSCDFVTFDTLTFPDVATGTPAYGASGISVSTGSTYITAKSCSFNTNSTATGNDGHGNIAGAVYFRGQGNITGGHVISDCTVTGKFRDGFGGEGNGYGDGPVNNSDICHNTVSGMQDDGIECEGSNINVRIWDNDILNSTGQSILGVAGTNVGPFYVFRNWIHGTNGLAAVKEGNTSPGPAYFFHNTISATGAGTGDGFSDLGGPSLSDYGTYLNNIVKTQRYGIYRGGRNNIYNYNLYNPTGDLVDEYNGTGHYVSRATFNAGTGQEANGLQGNPLLNSDGTLQAGSPAIDTGSLIANFNDSSSPWAYSGSAPDMGFDEYGGFGAPPVIVAAVIVPDGAIHNQTVAFVRR